MNNWTMISGFSDEISTDFDTQLEVVSNLRMHYISLRGIDGKNIGEFTVDEIKKDVLPRLQRAGIGVSSIGSPIGKVFINDKDSFAKQKVVLERLCEISKVLDCRYIRVFSFYIPDGEDADSYKNAVISQLKECVAIAEKHDVVLLHENEKDIYGDIARRCQEILNEVASPHFKAIFDFANFVQCGEDTQACYDLLKNDIEYIHIKDAVKAGKQNVLCGTGDGKISEILAQAIHEGYEGFLTLEPHLVRFDSLKNLELGDSENIIKDDNGLDGASGYKLQYEALQGILAEINSEMSDI